MNSAQNVKLIRVSFFLIATLIVLPVLAVPSLVVLLQLNELLEETGICLTGKKIESHDEALVFAKTVLNWENYFEEAGFQRPQDYVSAIEAKPNCCSVSYGQRLFEDAGQGWHVSFNATHLKNRFLHEIEFSRCGGVTYDGGMSLTGVN
ncbi:hypothetical protein [Microvirga flavescens]|uniref:hypothetical protein n=1 Tax=Microvirga flavescens TaxID=2249811 RepID=UPI0013003F9D|nr:hypothetical protein [Microvirga flavescens]